MRKTQGKATKRESKQTNKPKKKRHSENKNLEGPSLSTVHNKSKENVIQLAQNSEELTDVKMRKNQSKAMKKKSEQTSRKSSENSEIDVIAESSDSTIQKEHNENIAQLARDILELSGVELEDVLHIVQSSELSFQFINANVAEIDFLALNPLTIRELENYVSSCLLKKSQTSNERNLIDFKSLKKMVEEKKQQVAELERECDRLDDESPSDSDENSSELSLLNSEYLRLISETEILELSKPTTIPNFHLLRFAWAREILRNDVKDLEEMLSFQKHKKEITSEKKSELLQLCDSEQQIDVTLKEESFSQEDLLENEELKSEILQCLHTKLIRRLRRIARKYFPAAAVKESKGDEDSFHGSRDMFYILRKLLVELEVGSAKWDKWQPDDWEKTRLLLLDESIPNDYVQLLLKNKIVEFTHEDSLCLKLVKNRRIS